MVQVRRRTETGEAPASPGARTENIGHIRGPSNAARRDASPVECRPTCTIRAARPRPGERGVTLLETLIASAILSVGMLGLVQLLATSLQLHQLAGYREEASRLATAKVEELSKLSFSSAAIQVTPTSPNSLETNVANHFDAPTSSFTRRWRVDAGPTAETRLVTVHVAPASRDGRLASNVEIATIIRQW